MTQIKDVPELVGKLPKEKEVLGEKEEVFTADNMNNACNETRLEILETDLPDPYEVVGIDVEKLLKKIVSIDVALQGKGYLPPRMCIILAEAIAAKSKDILTWKESK